MRLGVWFATLCAGAVFAAVELGGWGWVFLWPAATLAACAAGYLGAGAGVFGKRPDGSRALWATLLMAPYILGAWLTWRALRLWRREPAYQELVPGLFIGRRLLGHELPRTIHTVVDLTAEMWEAAGVRDGRRYLGRPILDGHVPHDRELIALVREIDNLDGAVFVHCAEGRGRTGMLAAALLIARGRANDVAAALAAGRSRRPTLRLSPAQKAIVERVRPRLRWH